MMDIMAAFNPITAPALELVRMGRERWKGELTNERHDEPRLSTLDYPPEHRSIAPSECPRVGLGFETPPSSLEKCILHPIYVGEHALAAEPTHISPACSVHPRVSLGAHAVGSTPSLRLETPLNLASRN
jgi:hypothetical protein